MDPEVETLNTQDPLQPATAVTSDLPPDAPTDAGLQAQTVRFLTELGTAMIVAGATVTETRQALEHAASAYGLRSQIGVMPTMLIVKLEGRDFATVDVASALNRSLRLDQIASVWRLAAAAQ